MPLQAITRCAQQQPLSLHSPYQAGAAVAAVSNEVHAPLTHKERLLSATLVDVSSRARCRRTHSWPL